MKKEIKQAYSFRITRELREKLQKAAKKKEVSEGTIIRMALKKFLNTNISSVLG